MSATKQVKELLKQVRQQLDAEAQAKIEPILRQILEVTKPNTITEVVYRSDPNDQAAIAALQATISEKDDAIGKLRFKMASRQLSKDMPLNELLAALDKRGSAFHECFWRCLHAARADERSRLEILRKALGAFRVTLSTYLRLLIPPGAIDSETQMWIVSEAIITALQQIVEKVHAKSGLHIDFKVSLAKRS
ncbi:MAG TPA: hypothetical protein VMV10_09860 [Pirellulales bacterium]|nr:hypothetical protein [Pirellulales bacterium]